MFIQLLTRTLTAGLVIAAGFTAACGEASPTVPSSPAPPPAIFPTGPAPTITSVSPAVGSTGGDTPITITGTGLAADALVTLGGVAMTIHYRPGCSVGCVGATTLIGESRPRAAGTVDLVVTNPDRQTAVLAGGYTYAAPDTFDFNGTWDGGAITGHVLFGLTIEGDMLISVSCDDSGTVTLPSPAPVIQGAFSYAGNDGVAVSGKIVSDREAVGRINLAPCLNADWYASKR